jgi:ABC-type nickel/cobalt efflux system permease component RcnA
MDDEALMQFLSGCLLLTFGIWFFFQNLKDSKKGYKSDYGNDIGLYGASICAIIIGLGLIWRVLTLIFK